MLSADSLVLDLIFQANADIDVALLTDALGGEEALSTLTILDPDTQDPRLEMELSPSMPFRRRGERRLMVIDPETAPLREDPTSLIIEKDIRPYKEKLLSICHALPIRFARLFALGTWGDALWIARNATDFRGIALLSWVLDPSVDVDGKKRASQLSQAEFEEKIVAYDKRLEELDENTLLQLVGPATFLRDGDYMTLDVLDEDGYWDLQKSIAMEMTIAALDKFAMIPGAPVSKKKQEPTPPVETLQATAQTQNPPLGHTIIKNNFFFLFPNESFNLDFASAIGKKDWDTLLRACPEIPGAERDMLFRDGAEFVAPIEFLSEVSLNGQPLTKNKFAEEAKDIGQGDLAMEVHVPRFGHATLIALKSGERLISSQDTNLDEILDGYRCWKNSNHNNRVSI